MTKDNLWFHIQRYGYPPGVHLTDDPERTPFRKGIARVVIADPPYNIGVDYENDSTGDLIPLESYQSMLARAMQEQRTWMAPNATCWWIVPVQHAFWIRPMLEAAIGPSVYTIAWHETFSQYNRADLTRDFRMILCHTNGDAKKITRNMDAIRVESQRQIDGDSRADPRGRIPGTVWKFRRLQGTSTSRVKWHNAQLPPELIERIVRGWSDPMDVVMDGYGGSGSAGVVALQNDRNFIAVDKSGVYCSLMEERLNAVMKDLQ